VYTDVEALGCQCVRPRGGTGRGREDAQGEDERGAWPPEPSLGHEDGEGLAIGGTRAGRALPLGVLGLRGHAANGHCMNFIYFVCHDTLTLCSCFYVGQEPKRKEQQMRVGSSSKIWS
jgi:hypothetical protein